MSFTKEEMSDGILIIRCPNQVTINNSDELKKIFEESVTSGRFKFIVDLSETEYVDSSGLGAIVSRISITRSNDGDVRIASAFSHVKELLEITNLNKILKCFDDVQSAISGF